MHGHTLAIYASAASALLLASSAITPVYASPNRGTVPNYKLQRRSYRHDEDLRMRIRRSTNGFANDARGGGHVLKARFTPAPGADDEGGEEATPTSGVVAVPIPVESPNTSPGITTPDNVAPDTWTEDAGCAAYYAPQSGETCNSILEQFGSYATPLDTFYAINPSVNEECTNLMPGLAYCVALGTPVNVAEDTLTVEQGCLRYQTVVSGDFCLALVSDNKDITGITLEELYESNPSIDAECSNLWIDTSYCVGLNGGLVEDKPEEEQDEEEEEEEEEGDDKEVDCPPRKRRM